MNKLSKRICAALVAFAMLVCMVPFAAFAADTGEIKLETSTVETSAGSEIVITLYYKGPAVQALAGELDCAGVTLQEAGVEAVKKGADYVMAVAEQHEDGVVKYAWVNPDYQEDTSDWTALLKFYFDADALEEGEEEGTYTVGAIGQAEAYQNAVVDESTGKVSETVNPVNTKDYGETAAEGNQTTGGTVTAAPDYLLGDADGDGYVDSWDATLIARYEVGLIDGTDLNLSACDVDGDGYVDSWDATLIARYEVGLIESFR